MCTDKRIRTDKYLAIFRTLMVIRNPLHRHKKARADVSVAEEHGGGTAALSRSDGMVSRVPVGFRLVWAVHWRARLCRTETPRRPTLGGTAIATRRPYTP